jgi:hypothetical protein
VSVNPTAAAVDARKDPYVTKLVLETFYNLLLALVYFIGVNIDV